MKLVKAQVRAGDQKLAVSRRNISGRYTGWSDVPRKPTAGTVNA